MIITPADLEKKDRYQLFTKTILPRPIAWVSSMGKVGNWKP